ncbi:MAG: tRNA (adenosine(37)-N6)-threonylcarbamoyltransferase complex ATPase subunit type 1 TsaE [Pseudomonadota bacterium]
MREAVFILAGPEDTVRLGRLLGARLIPGDVVALKGALGAGKTCLTGGLALGLGVAEDEPVVSPSFVLAHEYQGCVPLFHLDLYRLEEEDFFLSGLD